jgi:hypothetical protein
MIESCIIGTLSKARVIQDAFHSSVTVRRKGRKHSVPVKLGIPRFERAALKKAAVDEGFTLDEALTQRVRQAVETGYLNSSPPSAELTPLSLDTGKLVESFPICEGEGGPSWEPNCCPGCGLGGAEFPLQFNGDS